MLTIFNWRLKIQNMLRESREESLSPWERENLSPNTSRSSRSNRLQQPMVVVELNSALMERASGENVRGFLKLKELNLHLKEPRNETIRKIENLHLVPNLQLLNLSYNSIERIDGLRCLSRSLIELNLAENQITAIENLSFLHRLERLNLSGNKIASLPSSISHLVSLKTFRIARNQLSSPKELDHLSPLTQLARLRIDGNPFSSHMHTSLYAVFSLPQLEALNGVAVNDDAKVEAKLLFGSSTAAATTAASAPSIPTVPSHVSELTAQPSRPKAAPIPLRVSVEQHAALLYSRNQSLAMRENEPSLSRSEMQMSSALAASSFSSHSTPQYPAYPTSTQTPSYSGTGGRSILGLAWSSEGGTGGTGRSIEGIRSTSSAGKQVSRLTGAMGTLTTRLVNSETQRTQILERLQATEEFIRTQSLFNDQKMSSIGDDGSRSDATSASTDVAVTESPPRDNVSATNADAAATGPTVGIDAAHDSLAKWDLEDHEAQTEDEFLLEEESHHNHVSLQQAAPVAAESREKYSTKEEHPALPFLPRTPAATRPINYPHFFQQDPASSSMQSYVVQREPMGDVPMHNSEYSPYSSPYTASHIATSHTPSSHDLYPLIPPLPIPIPLPLTDSHVVHYGDDQQTQLEQFEQQYMTIKHKVHHLTLTAQDIMTHKEATESEVRSGQREVIILTSRRKQLQDDIDELLDQQTEMQRDFDLKQQGFKSKIDKLQSSYDDLLLEFKEVKQTLGSLNEEQARLRPVVATLQESKKELELSISSKRIAMIDEQRLVASECESAQLALRHLHEGCESKKSELEASCVDLRIIERKREELLRSIRALDGAVLGSTETMNALKAENESLSKCRQSLAADTDKLSSEQRILQCQLDTLRQAIENAKGDEGSLKGHIVALRQEEADIAAQNIALRNNVHTQRRVLQGLGVEIVEMKSSIGGYKDRVVELEEMKGGLDAQIAVMQKSLADTVSKQREAEHTLSRTRSENAKFVSEIHNLQKDRDGLLSWLEEGQSKLIDQRGAMQQVTSEIEKLSTSATEENRRLDALRQNVLEKEALLRSCSSGLASMKDQESVARAEKDRLQSLVVCLKQDKCHLSSELSEVRQQIQEERSRLGRLESAAIALHESQTHARTELSTLQTSLLQTKSLAHQEERRLEDMRMLVRDQLETRNEIQGQINVLHSDVQKERRRALGELAGLEVAKSALGGHGASSPSVNIPSVNIPPAAAVTGFISPSLSSSNPIVPNTGNNTTTNYGTGRVTTEGYVYDQLEKLRAQSAGVISSLGKGV